MSQGFDEFMNVVLDNAAEVSVKGKAERRELGEFSALCLARLASAFRVSFRKVTLGIAP